MKMMINSYTGDDGAGDDDDGHMTDDDVVGEG